MQALPLILLTLAAMAIAYRFYSKFLATYVAALDDSRRTPAHELHDGQNYHATNRWVLFGHHFAAISGAGPLIGPVLAIQFGYMPGLVWLVVGVCLAGAVQDMMVLAASVRHDGKSLAEIARRTLGETTGTISSIAIFFIVIIALSGLGIVVVKALGGEEVKLAAGTQLVGTGVVEAFDRGAPLADPNFKLVTLPPNTRVQYTSGTEVQRSEGFRIKVPADYQTAENSVTLPAKSSEFVRGSSWGVFTIACTIPIALLVGLYMYKIRPGKVGEASIIGAIGVLAATFAGNWIPSSPLEPYFTLTREGTIISICVYGFIASVLPVWLLLCPRDYLSSILKLATLVVLVLGIILANPTLHAPAVNPFFANGNGPNMNGAIFPFVFICIMCGAISGFHALVSSGTTPKMIAKESDVRMIGYGSMLLEGLVGVVALLAAAALPQGDYWAINIDLTAMEKYADTLSKMGASVDNLPVLEQQVGGESLRGRTGGAVTLAVGMAQIMTGAIGRFTSSSVLDGAIKYWYHFAIMFEALFILTTIDTGTRIARFLLQEILGRTIKPMERVDWMPGVIFSSLTVTVLWGGLIWTGSIATIWPMFGIANQLLAAIALVIVTTILVDLGRQRYIWVTLLPLVFVTITTSTAAAQMINDNFWPTLYRGFTSGGTATDIIQGGAKLSATVFLIVAYLWILATAIQRWIGKWNHPPNAAATTATQNG